MTDSSGPRVFTNALLKPKLDPNFYSLQDDEFDFFSKLTGITDREELKAHIISVQAKAYDVFGYPCIRTFAFTKLRIARLPGYSAALQLIAQRDNPILLDMGCCFGNDVRKAVLDGWPVENALASDLFPEFWEYGHQLFKSTAKTFPCAFIAGDVFNPDFVAPRKPFITQDEVLGASGKETPSLKDLHSLTPLHGKISAIHASAFFHLFDEDRQLAVAQRLASLLSPEKGSIIFGQHIARPVKGFRTEAARLLENNSTAPDTEKYMFCHSPESWKQMWIEDVFGMDGRGAERIQVYAQLKEVVRKDLLDHTEATEKTKFWFMNWHVVRL